MLRRCAPVECQSQGATASAIPWRCRRLAYRGGIGGSKGVPPAARLGDRGADAERTLPSGSTTSADRARSASRKSSLGVCVLVDEALPGTRIKSSRSPGSEGSSEAIRAASAGFANRSDDSRGRLFAPPNGNRGSRSMEPDRRHRQISDIYHAALARNPAEREAFVRNACDEDEALWREVESLLQYEPQSSGFLESRRR